MRAIGQFQIDRQRRIEVRQDLAHDGNKGETVSGVLLKLGVRDHAKHPSKQAVGRSQRHCHATIASHA
jgi:hypothetical protein